MLISYTANASDALLRAKNDAERRGHAMIDTGHLLSAMLRQPGSSAVTLLMDAGVDAGMILKELGKIPNRDISIQQFGDAPFSHEARISLGYSALAAHSLGDLSIGTEHLLLGFLHAGQGMAFQVLSSFGLKIAVIGDSTQQSSEPVEPVSGTPGSNKVTVTKEWAITEAFCRNLTQLAAQGKLDPVIGRQNELDRTLQVLCRRTKNNPVLVGDAGVGKTAIVEGLAQRIADREVPYSMQHITVYQLDLPLLIAGTKYRGEFEERFTRLLEEVRTSGQIILFIDELHTVLGAGSAVGTIDAAHILKPALARGEIRCIGATTFDEYRRHILRDTALERRFQTVVVEPPSVEETVRILQGLKPRYEAHHNVRYTNESLEAAVWLSDRYITGRYHPDKAIDLIDEAGARAFLESTKAWQASVSLADTSEVETAKQGSMLPWSLDRTGAPGKPGDQASRSMTESFEDPLAQDTRTGHEFTTLGREEISQIVSLWTGIPLTKLTQQQCEDLAGLEDQLEQVVVGQREAINSIARAVRRSRAGVNDPFRPMASFLFVGPTGVGKTLLAQAVAQCVFGTRDSLIHIDMSEYMEKFSVSRLIGAPPGYVGYEEGGQLTEKVRKRPYSVVLLDEIEKAHQDVPNHLLLQVLEQGCLTDGLGRRSDFRNTIIIMTSNVGTERIRKHGSLGFSPLGSESSYRDMNWRLLEEVNKAFRPEFVNRIDGVLVFKPLTEEGCHRIVRLEVHKFSERLREKQIALELTDHGCALLVEKGFDPLWGARPLKRTIQRLLEDPVAEGIISGWFTPGSSIRVDRAGDELVMHPSPAV